MSYLHLFAKKMCYFHNKPNMSFDVKLLQVKTNIKLKPLAAFVTCATKTGGMDSTRLQKSGMDWTSLSCMSHRCLITLRSNT